MPLPLSLSSPPNSCEPVPSRGLGVRQVETGTCYRRRKEQQRMRSRKRPNGAGLPEVVKDLVIRMPKLGNESRYLFGSPASECRMQVRGTLSCTPIGSDAGRGRYHWWLGRASNRFVLGCSSIFLSQYRYDHRFPIHNTCFNYRYGRLGIIVEIAQIAFLIVSIPLPWFFGTLAVTLLSFPSIGG